MKNIAALLLLCCLSAGCSERPPPRHFLTPVQEDIKASKQFARRLQYHEGKQQLAVGYDSGTIALWDTSASLSKREVKAHANRVNHISFTPEGNVLFSNAFGERATKLWDTVTGQEMHLIAGTTGPVRPTARRNLYAIGAEEHLQLFDLEKMALLEAKYPCNGSVTALATDPASGEIAVGTASGGIYLWRFGGDGDAALVAVASATPYGVGGEWVVGLHFAGKGRLYSVSRFGAIDEWDLARLDKLRSLRVPLKNLRAVQFLENKGLLAVSGTKGHDPGEDGVVQIVDLASGKASAQMTITNPPALAFLPGRDALLTVDWWVVRLHPLGARP